MLFIIPPTLRLFNFHISRLKILILASDKKHTTFRNATVDIELNDYLIAASISLTWKRVQRWLANFWKSTQNRFLGKQHMLNGLSTEFFFLHILETIWREPLRSGFSYSRESSHSLKEIENLKLKDRSHKVTNPTDGSLCQMGAFSQTLTHLKYCDSSWMCKYFSVALPKMHELNAK